MKLGIVGGALRGIEAAYLARKAGIRTLVIDRWERAPAFSLADEHAVLDVIEGPEAVALLRDCDAVLPATENLATLEHLAAQLKDGPPLMFDLQAFRVSRSKVLSNKLFRTLNVPMPMPWPGSGFPVIVKPSEDSGTAGVSRANSETQLRKGIEKARRFAEGVVIQEFVSGPSVSLEVIGDGADCLPLVATQVHFDDGYDCKMVTSPQEGLNFDEEMLRASAVKVASTLGLRGIMNVEAMVSGRVPKLIAIDARFPSQTPLAVLHSAGLNMVDIMVKAFTSNELAMPYADEVKSVICEHVYVKDGTMLSPGEKEMANHPDLRICPGLFGADEVITDRNPDRDRWAATVICTGADAAEARKKRRRVLQRIARECKLPYQEDTVPEVPSA